MCGFDVGGRGGRGGGEEGGGRGEGRGLGGAWVVDMFCWFLVNKQSLFGEEKRE